VIGHSGRFVIRLNAVSGHPNPRGRAGIPPQDPSDIIKSRPYRDGLPFYEISVGDQFHALPRQNFPSS
jgi:hypothetical protein